MLLRFIDFEYNSTAEPKLNLVSYAQRLVDSKTKKSKDATRWLYGCSSEVKPPSTDAVLVAFNVIAEASALYSWGVNPLDYKWIDLQAEYRMITNHWDKYRYGKQLIDGKEVTTLNPRLKERKPNARFDRPQSSLAAACYKMLGFTVDTKHKTEIRDLIIRNNADEINDNKQQILDYNLSDVAELPKLLSAIVRALKEKNRYSLDEMLERGESVAHTALISMRGYPVDRKALFNFSQSVPEILKDVQEHINEQFPEMGVFSWDKKNKRYSMKQKPIKDWIEKESGKAKQWPKTEKDAYSLSFIDAWQKLYSFRSPYPENNFPAQMYRFLNLRQSLNGFIPKGINAKDKSNFFTHMGKDSRVRPYLNPYGAQSSRFQPKATGYLPLKPSWMRAFIVPPKGSAICGIDYKSQEFLIAALLSGDKKMVDSYKSGDVYFDFAKKAGAVPRKANRSDHPKYELIRTKFKSTVLAIQYLMGPNALADKLTADTGETHDYQDAVDLIETFEDVYGKFARYRDRILNRYRRDKYLVLSDGWTLFGDNYNKRSVANCPIQGTGAVVLRKAIKICHSLGLKVILPLHDALYIEFDETDFSTIDIFHDAMYRAFTEVFQGSKDSQAIKMDTYAISPSYGHDTVKETPLGVSVYLMSKYLESRGKDEYERFSKYFERRRS